MQRPTYSWESTSNTAMMEQSCLSSQSNYRSCSKNTQRRSVSARPGRRHTRTAHNATTNKEHSPLIPITTYLRLLGLLMYLTNSQPDIMTAVSFGATNSTSPIQADYDQLYYIVEYIRVTADKGHRIFIGTSSAIQLYCKVDVNYRIYSESKGHNTGYTMGLHPNGTFYIRSAK